MAVLVDMDTLAFLVFFVIFESLQYSLKCYLEERMVLMLLALNVVSSADHVFLHAFVLRPHLCQIVIRVLVLHSHGCQFALTLILLSTICLQLLLVLFDIGVHPPVLVDLLIKRR